MSTLKSINPATLEISGEVEITAKENVPEIVSNCRKAQIEWISMDKKDRIALMKKLRNILDKESELIAETVHKDTGKPKSECYSTEVLSCLGMAAYSEQLLRKFKFRQKVDQGPMGLMCLFMGRKSYIEYQPYGVIGVISSYNFPMAIPFTEIVMAVSAGNGVILKPSSDTPLCGELIENLFEKAGFPKNLVKTISGPGLGTALTTSNVDKIVFTGGTDTGIEVMKSAAESLKPVVLELGGKDAMIVCSDADVERAADGAIWASFVNSGQVCVSIKRIYVHSSVYDEFLKLYAEKVNSLKQGDGWNNSDVSVGPMINQKELERMESICEDILAQGGNIIVGGERNSDLNGYFFKPTVVTNLPYDAPIVSTEIFGPIVCVFSFEDEGDAIGMANNNPFALGGSIWTRDLKKGEKIASKLRSGTIDVNNAVYTYGLPATPWGGRGLSGIGTTHSEEGFKQLMHPHHIHVDKGNSRRDPWWMPYNDFDTDLVKDIGRSFFGDGKGMISTVRRFLKSRKNRT